MPATGKPMKRLMSLDTVTVLHQSPSAVAAATAQPKKFDWVQTGQLVPGFNPIAAVKPRQPAGAGTAPKKRSRSVPRPTPAATALPAAAAPAIAMPSLSTDLVSLPTVGEMLASLGTSILSDEPSVGGESPTAGSASPRNASVVPRGELLGGGRARLPGVPAGDVQPEPDAARVRAVR